MSRLLKAVVIAAASSLAFTSVAAFAAPAKPVSVAFTSTSANGAQPNEASVRVNWTGSASAVAYSVIATATGQSNQVGSSSTCVGVNCSASVANLMGGIGYSFVVTAIASDGSQTSSDPSVFTARSVPAPPAPLAPEVSAGNVVLTWASPTNTGGIALAGYTISETSGAIAPIDINTPNSTSYTVQNITGGRTYNFTIRSRNNLGSSSAADFASVTPVGAPAAPTSVIAEADGTSIEVRWSAPSSNGAAITGYKIYLVNSATNTDVGQFTSSDTTTGAVPNVLPGSYRVQVVATNSEGDGPRSAASSIVTIGSGEISNTPVFSPSNLGNLDIGETVALSATAPSSGIVTLTAAGSCTLIAGTLRAVSEGNCTITATVPANATYAAGEATRTILVKGQQSITFPPIADQNLPGTISLTATVSSPLTIRYSVAGSCTLSGTTLTLLAVGGCSVTASQPGNARFTAAIPVTRSFVITQGSPLVFGPPMAGPGTILSAPDASTIFSTKKSTNAKKLVLTKVKTRTSIKLGQTVRAIVRGLPKGSRVSSILQTSEGYSYFLSARLLKGKGVYRTPFIKPAKKGTYTILTSIGTKTQTLVVRVR